MTGARLDLALAVLAISLALVGVRRAGDTTTPGRIPAPVLTRAPALPTVEDADSLAEFEALIVENDVFRLSNRPASVPFTLAPISDAFAARAAPPAPAPRPKLVLRAIMGGPPWLAVLDGLPGQEGSVTVREGATFEKLVVHSVGRDTVVVQSPDTTWKLTISRQP